MTKFTYLYTLFYVKTISFYKTPSGKCPKGYEQFKIGVMLKQARLEAGFTQEQVANKLKTGKSAISRIENHAEDIRLSTLVNYAQALGKSLKLEVA